jgi:transposase
MMSFLNNEKLHNLCTSRNINRIIDSRNMKWVEHVARMRDEKFIQNMVRKFERKRPLGRRGHIWEDNIKTDLRKIGWEGVN